MSFGSFGGSFDLVVLESYPWDLLAVPFAVLVAGNRPFAVAGIRPFAVAEIRPFVAVGIRPFAAAGIHPFVVAEIHPFVVVAFSFVDFEKPFEGSSGAKTAAGQPVRLHWSSVKSSAADSSKWIFSVAADGQAL